MRRRPGTARPATAFAACAFSRAQAYAAELREPIAQKSVDYAALVPVSDDAYAVLAQQLEYSPAGLDPRVETHRSRRIRSGPRERITLATGYDDTRFAVQLFLPTGGAPPYQAMFYVPHAGFMSACIRFRVTSTRPFPPSRSTSSSSPVARSSWSRLDGTFERRWSPARRQSMSVADRYRTRLRHARQDLGRAIDYLATRKDIDIGRLGWFGVSYGAQAMMPVLGGREAIPGGSFSMAAASISWTTCRPPSSSTTTCRGSRSRC